MNSLVIPLQVDPEQLQRLLQLQVAFAEICNALAPQVSATRCWNRVALHHMAYKSLRERFPTMGSQMVCNAIYSVSRSARLLFQHPHSPFHLSKLGARPLPLMQFSDTCPVYFDRHTLSLKHGQLSMYTLDGRMRFQVELLPENEADFQHKKLREIVLARSTADQFVLSFLFSESDPEEPGASDVESGPEGGAVKELEIPEYIVVREAA